MGDINGTSPSRAEELSQLLEAVKDLIHNYIQSADAATPYNISTSRNTTISTLVDSQSPKDLESLLATQLALPETGQGAAALVSLTQDALFKYSVNTWHRGFMDKLYSSTNPIGIVAELLLAVLNTNAHVYQVSPVLTLVERHTARQLAGLLGLQSEFAGGISQPGGSAANQSSMVIARNVLFPGTKSDGYGGRKFVIFTSAHGHYSVEKAANMFGFGSKAVWSVPVDAGGRMDPKALDELVQRAKSEGYTPFYVNATAGTTVLGSFDPLEAIADVCAKHGLWMHIDGSWGASVAFSDALRVGRLDGSGRADSISISPHKMLGVPVTCSFLLGKDLRQFHRAMTLPAEYLFHNNDPAAVNDLADLTPQCGRKADSLKLFLGWTYYGRTGYAAQLDHAYSMANHLFSLLSAHPHFVLVSTLPLPLLQVCFYWAREGQLSSRPEEVSQTTVALAQKLIGRGFMVDYAPGERGRYFRVVVNRETRRDTLEGLVAVIDELADELRL